MMKIILALLLLVKLTVTENPLPDHPLAQGHNTTNLVINECKSFFGSYFFHALTLGIIPRSCYCSNIHRYNDEPTPFAARIPGDASCAIECLPCSVSYPLCDLHKICCPNLKVENRLSRDEKRRLYDVKQACIQLNTDKDYFVVKSCPKNYANINTKQLCEGDLGFDNITGEGIAVVTGTRYGMSFTFYNKFCAECHNAENISEWRWEMKCPTGLPLLSAMTKIEVLRLGLNGNCRIVHSPGGLEAHECDRMFYSNMHVVGTCDKAIYPENLDLHEKCNNGGTRLLDFVRVGGTVYENIHCAFCNNYLDVATNGEETKDCILNGGNPSVPPLHIVLGQESFVEGLGGSDSVDAIDGIQCQETGWDNSTGACVKLLCTEGKVLTENGCETVFPTIVRGLPYSISFLLEVHNLSLSDALPRETWNGVVEDIVETVQPLFSPFAHEFGIHFGVALEDDLIKTNSRKNEKYTNRIINSSRYVWTKIFLVAKPNLNRDVVEHGLLETLRTLKITAKAYSHPFTYRVQSIYESTFTFQSSCVNINRCALLHAIVNSSSYTTSYYQDVTNFYVSEYVEFLSSLTCPYVELSRNEVVETVETYPVPHVTKIVITLEGGFVLELTQSSEMTLVSRGKADGVFQVCKKLIDILDAQRSADSKANIGQYVLLVVCVSASVVCLLVTVISYCLIPDLRCVADWNTMWLSISLILAQILLFVANDVNGPSTACTVIGLIAHYLWLVVFSWTFLCCLHMLRIFAGINTNSTTGGDSYNRKQNREKVVILLVSLLVPALITVVIVVTNIVVYVGDRIGNGYNTCAVDNHFAVNGPLLFVITCNIVFFIVAVCKSCDIKSRQQNAENRKSNTQRDFLIYVQFSILTGMFWLMTFLAEEFDNDIMRYVAIILNGCLGVFIFFGFVFNRRVLRYYKERFNTQMASPAKIEKTTPTPIE